MVLTVPFLKTIPQSPAVTAPFTQGSLRSALPVKPSSIFRLWRNPPSPKGRLNKKSTRKGAFFIKPSPGAKLAKRAQWAKQRARFGAAVKIFKANAAEYFGHRKSTGGETEGFDG